MNKRMIWKVEWLEEVITIMKTIVYISFHSFIYLIYTCEVLPYTRLSASSLKYCGEQSDYVYKRHVTL